MANKVRLTHINICQVVPGNWVGKWRFDLHSNDGTVWTIEKGFSESSVLDRAEEFATFSGLPLFKLGRPI